MNQNILIVYPHNFFVEKSGINTRYIGLLNYFKARDFCIDMLTLKHFSNPWEKYPASGTRLVDNIFFYDFKAGERFQLPKNRKKNIFALMSKRIPFVYAHRNIADFAFRSMKKRFNAILERKKYDYILISYVYWANLIKSDRILDSTTVLDLSDFMTLNKFDNAGGDVKIGSMIEEELRRVNLFNKVMCISMEEKNFFSQLAIKPDYHYTPFFMKENHLQPSNKYVHEYDIIFAGSDNPHNKAAMEWFFETIYPLFTNSIKILIVGRVCQHLKPLANVTYLLKVENIFEQYRKSKISICPLLGGTGMKIKVVEALSFGKPVVTTAKGVVGFPCKTKNGCLLADSPRHFADLVHQLLDDEPFYQQQSRMAKDFFMEHFEESEVYRKLDKIFLKTIYR